MIFDQWWLLWAGLALIEALQVLIIVVCVYMPIPIVVKDPWTGALLNILPGLELEREMFFFQVFLGTAIAFFLIGFIVYQRRFKPSVHALQIFCCVELIWVILQLFAAFKKITYQYPFYSLTPLENSGWVTPFFQVVLALAVFSKIMWCLPQTQVGVVIQWVARPVSPLVRKGLVVLFFMLMVTIVFIPNSDMIASLVVRVDQGEQWQAFFHHQWGFNEGLMFLMFGTVMYLAAMFYLLCCWSTSGWIAAFGVLMVLKFNVFHPGILPCIWVSPQQTLLIRWLDIIWFIGLWHLLKLEKQKLALILFSLGLFAALVHTAGMLNNVASLRIYDCLRPRQFFPFIFGFIIPLSYVITVLLLAWRMFLGQGNREVLLAMAFAIYGMVIYAVYIKHPFFYTYGAVIVPWMLIVCYWLKVMLTRLPLSWHRYVGMALVAVALLAVLTNRVAVVYPNIWHQGYFKSVGL